MRINTLSDLIERLEEIRDAHGDEVGVRLGDQPNYPFECSIGHICFDRTLGESGAVILCEGRQIAYGKKAWWEEEEIHPEPEEELDDTPERSAVREYPAMDDPREG